MNLSDFNTLAEAVAYTQTTYRKIGGNEARQFFSIMGALDSVEANATSTAPVEVIPGVPTTVGALCRSLLDTLKDGTFATDPNTQDGQLNRAASAMLVNNSVLAQAQVDGFFALSETNTNPFANKTEYDFQVAKGTVPQTTVDISANGDFCYKVTTGNCPGHAPRITTTNGTRITSFYNVDAQGMYIAAIPNEYRGQTLYVDNAYGVMG